MIRLEAAINHAALRFSTTKLPIYTVDISFDFCHLSTTQNKPAGYDINLFKITITFKIGTTIES